jgi:hypothetical protein
MTSPFPSISLVDLGSVVGGADDTEVCGQAMVDHIMGRAVSQEGAEACDRIGTRLVPPSAPAVPKAPVPQVPSTNHIERQQAPRKRGT